MTRRLWILPMILLTLLLSGCGVGRFGVPGADELYTTARVRALEAESGSVRGTITQGDSTTRLDWSGAGDGSHYRQSLTTPGIGEVITIRTGGETYLKAPKAWYDAEPSRADVPKQVYGEFVRLDQKEVGQALTLRTLVEQTLPGESLPRMEGLSARVVEVTVNGRPAYRVTFGGDDVIEVDAETRRLVRLSGADAGARQAYDVTFANWGSVHPVEPPETVN